MRTYRSKPTNHCTQTRLSTTESYTAQPTTAAATSTIPPLTLSRPAIPVLLLTDLYHRRHREIRQLLSPMLVLMLLLRRMLLALVALVTLMALMTLLALLALALLALALRHRRRCHTHKIDPTPLRTDGSQEVLQLPQCLHHLAHRLLAHFDLLLAGALERSRKTEGEPLGTCFGGCGRRGDAAVVSVLFGNLKGGGGFADADLWRVLEVHGELDETDDLAECLHSVDHGL